MPVDLNFLLSLTERQNIYVNNQVNLTGLGTKGRKLTITKTQHY